MKALTIAAVDLRRLLRGRGNLFFLFVLPMLIILLLGAVFGGSQKARIGIVNRDPGVLAGRLVSSLEHRPSTRLVPYPSTAALQTAVARGDVDAGLVIPVSYDSQLTRGGRVAVAYLGRPGSAAQQLRPTIQSAVADESNTIAAAQVLGRELRLPFGDALRRAQRVATQTPRVQVRLTAPDGTPYTATSGRFEQGASTELVLFIFFTSITGSAFVIETRRLGIARRILSTPTSTRTIVAGQFLGRLAIALVQALIIVAGSMLFFGVTWGDPLGSAGVILAFSAVGTGVAMLVAGLCATEQQALPIAYLLGLGLAALGGSMAPLEVFPPTARAIAHITPHAWANDAFSKLLHHGAGLIAVLPQIGVLLAFAALATAIAIWRLQQTLTS